MAPIKRRSSSQNAATESGTGRSPAPLYTSLPTVLKPADAAALTSVVSRAVEVLGSKQRAFRWLGSAAPSLKNATPISLLYRAKGRESVLTVLDRMEHGIF